MHFDIYILSFEIICCTSDFHFPMTGKRRYRKTVRSTEPQNTAHTGFHGDAEEGNGLFHPPETVSAVPAENDKEADLISLLFTLFLVYCPARMCFECHNRAETVWRHSVA